MFENLKSILGRIDAECVELTHEVLASVDRELAKVKGEVTSFLDAIKAHLTQYPEPIFAILRRIKPILLFENYALVTRFEDVQEVLARDDVFLVIYGKKMRVVTGGEDFFSRHAEFARVHARRLPHAQRGSPGRYPWQNRPLRAENGGRSGGCGGRPAGRRAVEQDSAGTLDC